MADSVAKHGGIRKAEGRTGDHELLVRYESTDDSRRGGVAGTGEKRPGEDCDRYVLFRIFYRIRIGTGSFKTQESPDDDSNGVFHRRIERHIGRIPGFSVDVCIEEETAGKEEADDRNHDADDTERGEFAKFLRADQTDGRCKKESSNGSEADFDRRKVKAEDI